MSKLSDEDLAELSEHAHTFQCSRGKVLTERVIVELRELRALFATPWPEHLDEIRSFDNGRGLRIVLPFGGESFVFQRETALAIAAGLVRAALAAKKEAEK